MLLVTFMLFLVDSVILYYEVIITPMRYSAWNMIYLFQLHCTINILLALRGPVLPQKQFFGEVKKWSTANEIAPKWDAQLAMANMNALVATCKLNNYYLKIEMDILYLAPLAWKLFCCNILVFFKRAKRKNQMEYQELLIRLSV